MRFPDGYAWDYPGIPSLTVSYEKTTDFFFSGHVGLTVLMTLDHYAYKNYPWAILALATGLIEFSTMIFLRGHYTIDLITGVLLGHYFWIVGR